ncbi:hypothetical protein EG348_17400 [Chryseobacterium sp. G0201]|nr:hypothetical protein EG348_17400 [Chryseobacterium sp. G0201]
MAGYLFISKQIFDMNNKIKLALGLIATGTLVLLNLKRKRRERLKIFTAPDGNTYKENQTYRTFDNQFYKNGKRLRFNTLEAENENHSSNSYYEENSVNYSNSNQNKNITYHQKGNRHQ